MKYFYFIFLLIAFFLSCSEKQDKKKKVLKNPFIEKAYHYLDHNKPDKAYIYFNNAKNIFLKQGDSTNTGNALINMGIISTDHGDHFGAQAILFEAISYLNASDTINTEYLRSAYSTLGVASSSLKDYGKAIDFYNQALKFDIDSNYFFTIKNNIGNAYRDKGDYEKALNVYVEILEKGNKEGSRYAKTLTNYAVTKWYQNKAYTAAPELLKALYIRQNSHDLIGQNSSYSHLSDYYSKTNIDSALYYADKMYEVNKKINSPDDKLSALKKLVRFSSPQTAQQYFEIHEQLADSIQTARNIDKNQFAPIRYETEKHKSDSLKAQAENVEKQKNILIQYIGIGILTVSLISGYFWYRRRQKIMKQEKEIEVKNTALTYSKKVHDRVANKVYHVMTEVEYSPAINKESILQKLDVLYNISRDISHDTPDLEENKSFSRQLMELLISYRSENREINIYGNHDEVWANIIEEIRNEVFNILRELMINMKKHSQSNEVTIQFQKLFQHINITYTDNGIGIQKNTPFGNGLKNTETRIKNISGTITFETIENKGLEIIISFPFH